MMGIETPDGYRLVVLQKFVEENAIFDDFKTYKISNVRHELAFVKGEIPTLDDESEVEEFLGELLLKVHNQTEKDVDALVSKVESERTKQFERMQRLKRKHTFENHKNKGGRKKEAEETSIEWDTDSEEEVEPKPKGKKKPNVKFSL